MHDSEEEDFKEEDLKEVLEKGLYPCIGLNSQGGSVEVNFGHKMFKYAGNFTFNKIWFPLIFYLFILILLFLNSND